VTREERNVLLFVAFGVLLGSSPEIAGNGQAPADREEPLAPVEVVAVDLFPIDVNRAGAELLEELPGIGPAKARAIVELREERGAFRRVEELADVHGIGERTVEKLRELITLGEDPRVPSARQEANAVPRGRLVAGTSGDSASGERADHAGSARGRARATEVVGGVLRHESREDGGDVRE
jgi:competence protein ComEA